MLRWLTTEIRYRREIRKRWSEAMRSGKTRRLKEVAEIESLCKSSPTFRSLVAHGENWPASHSVKRAAQRHKSGAR